MAGKNTVLKEGQMLFKAGDQSNGMFLIRKGELVVFLEQDGKEVTLASVGDGGMIGEMALFDRKPRSASVKAAKETEVTLISNEDFAKLMKQIPKWFVGLMTALSGRLRATNERLQKVESGGSGKPYQNVVRMIHVINLIFHKDGIKEGKSWQVEKEAVENLLVEMFDEDPNRLKVFFEVMVNTQILATAKNDYNNVVLTMSNKGILQSLVKFIAHFIKSDPPKPALPDDGIEMLNTLLKIAEAGAYESTTVTLEDLEIEGKRAQLKTGNWKDYLPFFKNAGDAVKLVKTSGGGIGMKTNRKELKPFVNYHTVISKLYKNNLS